jgi:glycerol-3-phosphate O-acyltransferase/dihydroxyacetone phosphate acyltransferase
MGVTYRVIRAWARLLVTTWYRAEIRGAPFPTEVPCILVMNHTNGLCDGHFQLACTPRPVRVLAKYKLFEIPVLGWVVKNVGAIPVYRKKDGVDTSRNADSFRSIYEALAAGDVIAVFPEGESRGTPYLREVKTGAARMALGAEESAAWRAGVRIVPVGITYAEPGRFRSRAEGWIGESFAVHDSIGAYDHSPILAGRALTLRITEAMRALTLQVPPGDDDGRAAARLACAVERLMPPDERPLAARRQAAWNGFERLRERDQGGHALRVEAALQLDRNLTSHGLTATDVLGAEEAKPSRLVGELALRAQVGVPLLALCAVIWGLPILLARAIARRGASTPDKFVTVTLLTAFGIMVVWLPLLTWFVSSRTGPRMDLVVILVMGLGVAALPRVTDNLHEMRHLLGRLRLAGDAAARARLADAMTKLVALVDPGRSR